jgi:hypothetical protein
MIGERNGAFGGMKFAGEMEVLGGNLPHCHFADQKSDVIMLECDRHRASHKSFCHPDGRGGSTRVSGMREL